MRKITKGESIDITLIGAGIMSATLGILLKQFMPQATLTIIEKLSISGAESSDAWNNAGTGHSGFCELNYTPIDEDGKINISKALEIAEAFEVSKTFWASLIEKGVLKDAKSFVNTIPHVSFVEGKENIQYLKDRFKLLKKQHIFSSMEFSDNVEEITSWAPLMMRGRGIDHGVAATKVNEGTDVNFGSLTRHIFKYLSKQDGVNLIFDAEVTDIEKQENGKWLITLETQEERKSDFADFVFIGAGGGTLPLLEKSGIPEGKGYGGFPISGQWLKCNNKSVIKSHNSKVYGKAAVGAPPMSVPHLDTRMIDGEKGLLFGPYAGFTTKFLKKGSFFDLFLSVETHNILPMLSAGVKNIPLTKYLIEQVMQSDEDRFKELVKFIPEASIEDWELLHAGNRVQIIKKEADKGGVLKFGTEIVTSADGSLAALLGASPGASTSTQIMIELIEECFSNSFKSKEWQGVLLDLIPHLNKKLNKDKATLEIARDYQAKHLNLKV